MFSEKKENDTKLIWLMNCWTNQMSWHSTLKVFSNLITMLPFMFIFRQTSLKIMKEFFIFQSKEITSAIVWLFNTIAAIKDLSLPCAQLSDTVLVHLKNQYELRCIQMSNWREKLSENTKCLIEYFPVVCMNNKGHIFGTSFIRNDSNIQRMRV